MGRIAKLLAPLALAAPLAASAADRATVDRLRSELDRAESVCEDTLGARDPLCLKMDAIDEDFRGRITDSELEEACDAARDLLGACVDRFETGDEVCAALSEVDTGSCARVERPPVRRAGERGGGRFDDVDAWDTWSE